MTRINTNIASLRGIRSLGKAGNLLDQSLTRLSTGLKINSGKDNPSGLIASETLRTQVTAIEQSIKNSSRANNVIATADSALGEVNNLLNQVRGLVQESLNNGALSRSEIEANQNQVDAALDAINRISANTTFAGDKLIDGSKAFITQIGASEASKLSDFKVNTALFSSSSTIEVEAEITQAAEKGELRYTGGSLSQAATLEVSGSKGSQVVFLGGSSSKSDIRNAINSISDVTGVQASFTAGATFDLGATQGFADIETNAVAASLSIGGTGGATNSIDFTAVAAGSAGNNVNVVFTAAANTTTNVVSVSTSAGGSQISVALSKSAGGITATLSTIQTSIEASTTASGLVDVAITGAGGTTAIAAAAATLTGGQEVGFLKVSDNRNSGSGGSIAALGGEVFVQVADFATGTAVASLGVNSFEVDEETGNITVKIQLAKDTSGITSTLTDVSNFINTSTTDVTVNNVAVDLSTYISSSTSDTATTGNTVFSASGSQAQLLGGTDGNNNNFSFNDARAYGTPGSVQVSFSSSAAANQTLSVVVNDVSGSDDKTITFTLATDANGNIITTADDLKNLLEVSSDDEAIQARDLVSIEVEGDGSELIKEAAGTSETVDIASRILKLQSTNFGEDEFVQINVLSGSFTTVGSDNVSTKSRDVGADLEAVINGQQASTKGLEASIKTATLEASLSFNAENNVSGRRAAFTITGGGSLFQIGQEVSAAGQIGLGIEAVNTARLGGITGKLYEIGTGGGKTLLDVGTEVSGSSLVGIIEESIDRVTGLRGRLGAIQRNVIETNISSLGVALENISEARSVITDTDFAETTADLTKAQILNQAGISVLSIANQSPQQVLSLLG